MTIFGCVSPGTTVLILVALPIFVLPAYFLLTKMDVKGVSMETEYSAIPNSPLNSTADEKSPDLTYKDKLLLVKENLIQFMALSI